MSRIKKPRRRLERSEIVGAALVLADAAGLEALTMRSLAVEIGSDPTAVYRHFRDKQELLLAMVDLALAELRYPSPRQGWRVVARELAVSLREVLLAHPGVTTLVASGPPTPGTIEAAVQALTLLQAAGMPAEIAARGHRSVISYVVGWVMIEQGSGTEGQRFNFAAVQYLARDFPGIDPSVVADAIASDRSRPGEFEFGLDLLLAGLAAVVPETVPSAPAAADN